MAKAVISPDVEQFASLLKFAGAENEVQYLDDGDEYDLTGEWGASILVALRDAYRPEPVEFDQADPIEVEMIQEFERAVTEAVAGVVVRFASEKGWSPGDARPARRRLAYVS